MCPPDEISRPPGGSSSLHSTPPPHIFRTILLQQYLLAIPSHFFSVFRTHPCRIASGPASGRSVHGSSSHLMSTVGEYSRNKRVKLSKLQKKYQYVPGNAANTSSPSRKSAQNIRDARMGKKKTANIPSFVLKK